MAEFRKYFENFGGVVDAVVMFDRQTQRSRGFGFVTFQEDNVVHEIMMGSHEINGKMVEVKRAEPKENRSGRASRSDFPSGASQALGAGASPAFSGPRRSPPFGVGRAANSGYGLPNSYGHDNSTPFGAANAATYGQATYGYPGYGYNNQLFPAPAYGYPGRGGSAAYGTDGSTTTSSFAMPIPQPGYGLQAQDGQTHYTPAEYAAAVRNQHQAQAQVQHQAQAQAQQVAWAGESTYGSQPY